MRYEFCDLYKVRIVSFESAYSLRNCGIVCVRARIVTYNLISINPGAHQTQMHPFKPKN